MQSEIKYTVQRSARKTLAIQIKYPDVIVRSPLRVSDAAIKRFVAAHRDWIEKQLDCAEQRAARLAAIEPLSEKEKADLKRRALEVIPKKVEHYAAILGVTYGKISVRTQKTRWGSCSREGNLSFNCLLMLAPEDILDSVIVHELCHRKEMNHSSRFYRAVEGIMPDYKERRAWLRENGDQLMARCHTEK